VKKTRNVVYKLICVDYRCESSCSSSSGRAIISTDDADEELDDSDDSGDAAIHVDDESIACPIGGRVHPEHEG
jgi:hypothetical protein